jgi:hypothetical protein
LDYEWDEKKAAADLAKHGIDFVEAIAVFQDEGAILNPDPDAEESVISSPGSTRRPGC